MASLIRTNWINVQEFVPASVPAGLRAEEIKGNKRDLYVEARVYKRVCRCGYTVCARISRERMKGRERERKNRDK